ncbi:MAG: CHAT domain-containing protein [Spirochaetales bacterium]|nr:MAG: CHAT domain-containing protein [Spirochaetales bacterium]
MKIRILYNLGLLQEDMKAYQKAVMYYKEALFLSEKNSDKEAKSIILNGIGSVLFLLGRDEEASDNLRKAISLSSEIDAGQVLWNAFSVLAGLQKKQGAYKDALNSYEYAMDVIEKSRSSLADEDFKASFLGSNRRLEVYHGAIDLLFRLSQREKVSDAAALAFGFMERAKARGFLDSLEIGRVSAAQPVASETEGRLKSLQARLSRLSRRLADPPESSDERNKLEEEASTLEEDYDEVRRDLRTHDPRYAAVRFPELISLEGMRKDLLDDDTVVFTYAVGRESAYGLAIDRKGQRFFPLPSPSALRELVGRHLKWVSDRERSPERTGEELYRALIDPGLDGPCRRMLIVPDDFLHYLPFETLRSADDPSWMGARTEIAYVPSLSSLAEIEKRVKRQKAPSFDLLAVAAPDRGKEEGKTSLQFREREVEEIARLFDSGKRILLKGLEANEKSLKANRIEEAGIIHFAAHGTIDEQKPVRSAIVLRDDPTSEEDGFLQAREVFDFRLKAGLVVLSSCRSAGGRLLRGEGVVGLNRSFLFAGASTV